MPTWTPDPADAADGTSVCIGQITRDQDGRVIVPVHVRAADWQHLETQFAFDTKRLDLLDALGAPGSSVKLSTDSPGRVTVNIDAPAGGTDAETPLALRFAADADLSGTPVHLRLARATLDDAPAHCRR